MNGPVPDAVMLLPVDGIGEVRPGDDLAVLVPRALAHHGGDLLDGDLVVVTSKVLSKAEGRVRDGSREEHLAGETARLVARRGPTSIVRTHHGLVLAAAGIDASNTAPGTVLLLPADPDASARGLRERLLAGTGRNVAVLVTDTAGRAWRNGQTDLAVGAAGLEVLHDYAGRYDTHGNELAVTAPAVADSVAAAADLVKGKLDGRPAALVRGLGHLVLEPGQHGPGATALVRSEALDMFGLGAQEAVLCALAGTDGRGFGSPRPAGELVTALRGLVDGVDVRRVGEVVSARLTGSEREQGRTEATLLAAAHALGWRADPEDGEAHVLRFAVAAP